MIEPDLINLMHFLGRYIQTLENFPVGEWSTFSIYILKKEDKDILCTKPSLTVGVTEEFKERLSKIDLEKEETIDVSQFYMCK